MLTIKQWQIPTQHTVVTKYTEINTLPCFKCNKVSNEAITGVHHNVYSSNKQTFCIDWGTKKVGSVHTVTKLLVIKIVFRVGSVVNGPTEIAKWCTSTTSMITCVISASMPVNLLTFFLFKKKHATLN